VAAGAIGCLVVLDHGVGVVAPRAVAAVAVVADGEEVVLEAGISELVFIEDGQLIAERVEHLGKSVVVGRAEAGCPESAGTILTGLPDGIASSGCAHAWPTTHARRVRRVKQATHTLIGIFEQYQAPEDWCDPNHGAGIIENYRPTVMMACLSRCPRW